MTTASSIADAFEARRIRRTRELEEWVLDNPQWWAPILAASGATAMEFVGGYVDVLRLGEGAAEGGVAGWGTDALRVLAVLGPIGRVGSRLSPHLRQLMLQRGLRLAVRPKGLTGPCTFQAANNVAQLSKGKSLFVTLADMARARGKTLAQLPRKGGRVELAAFIDDLLPTLQAAGIRGSRILGLERISQIVALTRGTRRVVVFAFRTTVRTSQGLLREVRHSVIAFTDTAGRVRFADYGGKVYESLGALIGQWGQPVAAVDLMRKTATGLGAGGAVVKGTGASAVSFATGHIDAIAADAALAINYGAALVLEGMSLIETAEGAELAVPVEVAAAAVPADDAAAPPELVAESFENHQRLGRGQPVSARVRPQGQGVPRADWLTGVQYRLNHLGYAAGPVDGVMGPRTDRAVRRFQKDHPPLRLDGIPGPKTQARLVEVCGY